MAQQSISLFRILIALSPIASVLILMVAFRWGGARAGAAGWLVASLASLLFFGADLELIAYSQASAVLLSLYVLYIIWMALVLYNVVKEAGAIEVIAEGIVRLTQDRVLQLLILSWVFSAFLQGVAGFGVPIAVVAPLLMGLGFSPVTSVAAVAAGHSWSVFMARCLAPLAEKQSSGGQRRDHGADDPGRVDRPRTEPLGSRFHRLGQHLLTTQSGDGPLVWNRLGRA